MTSYYEQPEMQKHVNPDDSVCDIYASVTIGNNVTIDPTASIGACVTLGDNITIGAHVIVKASTYPYASKGSMIYSSLPDDVRIGYGVRIGTGVTFAANERVLDEWGDASKQTTIEDLCVIYPNVRIGARTLIEHGTVIGGAAVVGDDVEVGHDTSIASYALIPPDWLIPSNALVNYQYSTRQLVVLPRDMRQGR